MKTIDTELVDRSPELFLPTYSDEISELAEQYDGLGMLKSWTVESRDSVMLGCMTWYILLVFEDGIVQINRHWRPAVFRLNHLDHSP